MKNDRRGPVDIAAGRAHFAGRIAGKLDIARRGGRTPISRPPIGPVPRVTRAKRIDIARPRAPLALPRTRAIFRMAESDGVDARGLASLLEVSEDAVRRAFDGDE